MDASNEIRTSLNRIRRHWRRVEVMRVLAAAVVEIAGLLLVFMLADWLYRFPMKVRVGLLAGGALVAAGVLAHHVIRVLSRKIADAELALFVEKRNPPLQGALMSAVEFGGSRGTPLHDYIVQVLVEEAGRRVQMVDVGKSVDLGRLKKYGIACAAVVAAFVATGALFPSFMERQGRRILAPWVERPEDRADAGAGDEFFDPSRTGPIRFRVLPGDVEVLEGGSVEIVAELSRDPLGLEPTLFIRSGDKGDWEPIAMASVARLYTHRAAIEDVNRPLEYYVAAGNDASEHHKIAVRARLKIAGVEVTTEFPAYLRRPPEKALAPGDIATLVGSTVTLDIKTNQALREGALVMGDGSQKPLALGESGGRVTIPVEKDDTFRYVVRNALGEEAGSDRLYFIQALEDKPPLMDVLEPNVDLSVHPLSEVTCALSVTEDWALEAVRMQLDVIRQGADGTPVRTRETREFLPAAWPGRVDGGRAETVLALADMSPRMRPGDSMFYFFEVVDRKGQRCVSDLFFISVAEPDVFVYYGTLDWHAPKEKVAISPLMQFIAQAWRLEQERPTLAKDEFLARCTQLADKMIDPATGKVVDFIRLGADGSGKGPVLPDTDPRKKIAADHTQAGHALLAKGEPGQAVVEFKIVWAILKQFFGDASIMLAAADVNNPNRVILEKGESFALIEQLANIDKREMDRELQKQADQQVAWRRSLGRKDMEKVDEARKEIQKIKKDVAEIASDARENIENKPPDSEAEPKQPPKEGAAAGEGKKKPAPDGGEKKADGGEKKPAEGQPCAQEKSDSRSDSNKKPPTGAGASGEDELKERALDAAQRAEEVARKLQGVIGEQKDKDAREGLDRVRNAAEELKRAALDFDEKKLDEAEARARNAHRFLDEAEKDLGKLTAERLNDMVAAALGQAHRLADRQKTLREAADALDKTGEDVRRAKEKGDRTARAQEELMRERQKGASEAQAALSEQAEALKGLVERVHGAAKAGDEKNAEKALEEGVRAIKQGDLPQKMVDAAVELQQGNFRGAKEPQEAASKTLTQVVDSLYRASDALSGTKEGALARVAERAREIKNKGLELAGVDEKDLPRPADATKPDQPSGDEGKKDEPKPGDKPAKTADEGDLSRRRRREEAAKLWGEVRTLAGDLKPMEDVPQAAKDRIAGVGEDEFGGMFEERDPKKTTEFLALIARVSTLLDEKLAQAQAAKRLEAGLRDECPPTYRRLVGKYYSVLSTGE